MAPGAFKVNHNAYSFAAHLIVWPGCYTMLVSALQCRPPARWIVVLLCLSLTGPVFSQKTTGRFVNPPEWTGGPESPSNNAVYKVNDTMRISWSSNATSPLYLAIAQTAGNDSDKGISNIQYLPGSTALVGSTSFNWDVQTDGEDGQPVLDLTRSNIFRLVLLDSEDNGSDFAWSTWFNLSSSSVAADGSAISSATGQTSSTLSLASVTKGSTATPTSSTAFSTTTVSPSDLGAATRISIGIGIGIGVPLLLAVVLGTYLILKRWGSNDWTQTSNAQAEQPREKTYPGAPGMLCSQCHSSLSGPLHVLDEGMQKPQELAERALDPHELGSGTLK